MAIKQIFWDNDGVFVETEQLYFQSTREVLKTVGVDLDLPLYQDLLLNQARGAWFMAEERGCSKEEVALLVERRNQRYGELIEEHDVFLPGAQEVVAALAPDYAMGIVTSSRAEHFQLIHHEGHITQYMDFVLWSGMYEASKPNPAPYLKALSLSDYEASEAIVVEDSLRGLRAAEAAGITCVVIPSDMTKNQDFSAAYEVLNSIDDLPDLIKSIK